VTRHAAATSKQQRVYDVVRQPNVSGEYVPGQRLIYAELARELDVSPLPVREATRRLEAEGWLRHTRNVGASVAGISVEGIEQALQTLALVEGYATALAAPELEAADVAHLRRLNDHLRSMLDEVEPFAFSLGNHAFHDAILDRCPNDDLRALVARETDRFDAMRRTIYFPLFMPIRAPASVEEHEVLVDLIERRADPAEIEHYAREHKLRLGGRIRELGDALGGNGVGPAVAAP